MIITEISKGDVAIIAFNGTLDASSAPELRKNRALNDPLQTVVVDLQKLDFIDSSGLGAIVGVARLKDDRRFGILLSCMNDRVRKVFEITNAQKLFHIFDDTKAAVEYGATRQSTCK
ncbi:MAG: STAS domain-containing protein [Chlorobiaceae bacterium]|jgi:anti-sigma B factor antagonist|nr:STAS domain-containing protein [Chlorobiaceae bacterium]